MRAGQSLRGSSEFHAWGDSNLYLRRHGEQLTLSVEHRAAPSIPSVSLQLNALDDAVALTVAEQKVPHCPSNSRSSRKSSDIWRARSHRSPPRNCANSVVPATLPSPRRSPRSLPQVDSIRPLSVTRWSRSSGNFSIPIPVTPWRVRERVWEASITSAGTPSTSVLRLTRCQNFRERAKRSDDARLIGAR